MARKRKVAVGNKPAEEIHKKVQHKAYEIWQKKGCRHGDDWSHWYEAENTVKSGKC